ncbi:MAG: ABC transporter ATP-binding protein [Anaerolineae bacterium]|nr:ABC transporter ATP-binding protein [Anaerolineae bacterium]
MTAMIEVHGLRKTFTTSDGKRIEAVKGVDLAVQKGEIFSLLGPNGAGKTTTINMISGLIEPTEGEATIGGYSITTAPLKAKSLLGVIPQEIALYPKLSARQNLSFFGKMYGLTGPDLNRRIDEVLEFVDLADRQNDRVENFSGGMKRRVNIGVGLLHRPQVVYMDEPTVGIDPQNRRRVLDTVFRLRDEYDMTVLYTTHLMEEAQELSDRVGIIDHGEIIALGTQGELTQQVGEEDRLTIGVDTGSVPDELLEAIKSQVEGVTSAEFQVPIVPENGNGEEAEIGNGKIQVLAKRGRKALPRILNLIEEHAVEVNSVEVREPDLEAVFLHLTGRALRD